MMKGRREIRSRKAELGIETMFFILMGIIMIAIIVFGFNKIFLVNDTLSQLEVNDMKNQIEDAFNHCEDPLAKGDVQVVKFKNNLFNSVCVMSGEVTQDDFLNLLYENDISYDLNNIDFLYGVLRDVNTIFQSGDNVILFDSTFIKTQDTYLLSDFQITHSFNVNFASDKLFCQFDKEGEGEFELKLTC